MGLALILVRFVQGRKVNVRNLDASKACAALSGRMPQHVISEMMQKTGLGFSVNNSFSCSSGGHGGSSTHGGKNPLEESARQDILRGAEALFKQDLTFQEDAAYNDNIQDAEDALLIVQGIDPAIKQHQGSRGGAGGFIKRRDIKVEKRDWIASMRGIFATTKYGNVFVHSDGSLTRLNSKLDVHCKCGMIHPAV